MGSKDDEKDGPTTLTDVIRDIFKMGFQAGASKSYQNWEDAIENKAIEEKIVEIHEEYAGGMQQVVDGLLDMEDDEDDDKDKEKEEE